MSQWKNRIGKPGWYWLWHEYDWGYEDAYGEGRRPELCYFFETQKFQFRDRKIEQVIGKRKFGPYGMVSTQQGLTFIVPIEETTWFWGPIVRNQNI